MTTLTSRVSTKPRPTRPLVPSRGETRLPSTRVSEPAIATAWSAAALGNQLARQRAARCPALYTCPTGGACHLCPARAIRSFDVRNPTGPTDGIAESSAPVGLHQPFDRAAVSAAPIPVVGRTSPPQLQRACSSCAGQESESEDELDQLEEEDNDGETVQMKAAAEETVDSGYDELASLPDAVRAHETATPPSEYETVAEPSDSNIGPGVLSVEAHAESADAHAAAAPSASTTEDSIKPGSAPVSLIVEDSEESILEGQMTRQQFLTRLRSAVEIQVNAALEPVGRSTDDCPYLQYWIGFYTDQDSARIERAVHRYAPESGRARSASEYIEIVAARAHRAALIWAESGRLTGVPDGVPLTIPAHAAKEPPVLRKPAAGARSGRARAIAVRRRLGPGRPIDPALKARMETAFGRSFSHVRTHDDARTASVSAAIGARAFTVGLDVAFAAGEYRPETPSGDALIAHELAHVIQQTHARAAEPLAAGEESEGAFEHEADSAAMHVVRRLWGGASRAAAEGPGTLSHLQSGLRLRRCASSSPRTTTPAAPTPPASAAPPGGATGTPCPTSVRLGATVQRNHEDQSDSEKARFRTWLGLMSQMNVGPGPDHTGHCMKERLTTVSNTCPAAVYERGGETTAPCTGNKCLDINRYGSSWGVSDGPTAFLDMHRTRAPESLLEGTGVNDCTVICEQTYMCDRTQPTTGVFQITRHFQAGQYTPPGGAPVHITTGSVTKRQTQ
jgi:hypothetical protein